MREVGGPTELRGRGVAYPFATSIGRKVFQGPGLGSSHTADGGCDWGYSLDTPSTQDYVMFSRSHTLVPSSPPLPAPSAVEAHPQVEALPAPSSPRGRPGRPEEDGLVTAQLPLDEDGLVRPREDG